MLSKSNQKTPGNHFIVIKIMYYHCCKTIFKATTNYQARVEVPQGHY